MPFVKGQSGNPSGRPAMPKEVREAVRRNGARAVKRMSDLLEDDGAWGPNGWLSGKEQILLATVAQERAFGKAHNVSVSFGGVSVGTGSSKRLREVADLLPERKHAQLRTSGGRPAIDAKVDL